MQSAACPRCAEPVRIPTSDASTTVRCPWCRETFVLSEALATLPPLLEIVTPEYANAAQTPYVSEDSDAVDFSDFAASVGAADAESAEEYSLVGDEDLSESSFAGKDFAGSGLSTAGSFDHDSLGDTSVRRSPPRRSRAGSPIKSFLKMAAGGVAGILIALLILQYMGRLPDLGFWPFLGPHRGAFADSRGGLTAAFNQPIRTQSSAEPPIGWQPTAPPANSNPNPNPNDGVDTPLDLPLPNFENQPDSASDPEMETEPAAAIEPEPIPASEPETAPEPEPVPEPAPNTPTEPTNPGEASSLQQSITAAAASLQQYNDRQDDDTATPEARLQPLAESLSELGGELFDAGGEAREIGDQREQIDALVDRLAADLPLLKQLLAAAGEQTEDADSESRKGVFAIGQLSAEGDELLLKKSTTDPDPLKMQIDDPGQVELPPSGAIVLVLGRFESDGVLHAGYIRSLSPRK